MDNSDSFLLESFSKSLFSPRATDQTIWRPIINSIQENHRLSRVIQVRESKMQELSMKKVDLSNTFSFADTDVSLDSSSLNILDSIIAQNQQSLKSHCQKLGSQSANISKAMEIVSIDPRSLLTHEKLEVLSALGVVKEKLIENTLDSEEVLGYFRDILLESEMGAAQSNSNKENLMKIIEKRVELFQGKSNIKLKIKEAYHLIMNLESFKGQMCARIDHSTCGAQIKELISELGQKQYELRSLRDSFQQRCQNLLKFAKNLAVDLENIKHCVEFELFNTWTALAGGERRNGMCEELIRRIKEVHTYTVEKNIDFESKIKGLKRKRLQGCERMRSEVIKAKDEAEKIRKHARMEFNEFLGQMSQCSKGLVGAVRVKGGEVRQCKQQLAAVKEEVSEELANLSEYLVSVGKDKLVFAERSDKLSKELMQLKALHESESKFNRAELEDYKSKYNALKAVIYTKFSQLKTSLLHLARNQKALRLFAIEELQAFQVFFTSSLDNLKSGRLRELSMKVHQLKKLNRTFKQETQQTLANEFKGMFIKFQSVLDSKLKPMCLTIKSAKFDMNSLKASVQRQLSDFNSEISRCFPIFLKLTNRQDNLVRQFNLLKHAYEENKGFVSTHLCNFQFALESTKCTQEKLINIIEYIIQQLHKLKLQKAELSNQFKLCLTNEKELLKTDYTTIKTIIEEVTTSHNDLKLRYEKVCDAHSATLLQNSALKSSVETLSSALSSITQRTKNILLTQNSLKISLQEIPKSLRNFRIDFSECIEHLKGVFENTSMTSDVLKYHTLQLEESVSSLQRENNELKSKHRELCEQKAEAKMRKVAKLKLTLRKLRAFKAVLMHEKAVIRGLHNDMYEWVKSKVVLGILQEVNDRELGERIGFVQKLEDMKMEVIRASDKYRELESKTQFKLRTAAKHVAGFISTLKKSQENLRDDTIEALADFENAERMMISSKIGFRNSSGDSFRIKIHSRCMQMAEILKSLREENADLHHIVDRMPKLATIEIESLKIKMISDLKQEFSKVKDTLQDLMQSYNTDHTGVLQENKELGKIIEAHDELSKPIFNCIKTNQVVIEELTENYEKSSKLTQKNIEENIQKLDNVCLMIEGFKEKGFELLNKYKQDVSGYLENSSEHSESVHDLTFNSLENSYASTFIEEESKLSLNNPLMKRYNTNIKLSMRMPSLVKMIEKVLGTKYKDDADALSRNRDPATMADYLISWLTNISKVTVDKKVCEILNTFQENFNDKRIRLYCRLFQVFDPNPISYKLSLYLIKMRYFFNVFIYKQVIPEASQKKVDKMQVTEILKTIRKLFNSDIYTGEVVLKHMKPENMVSNLWTISCIQYYFFIKSLSPKQCYESLVKEGSLTENEFVLGLTVDHETFVSEADLREIFNMNSTGFMTQDEFENLFDLKSYFVRDQKYMVDELQFLNALVEGYSAMRIRHHKELEKLITEKCGKKKDRLSKDEVAMLVNELDSTARPEKIFEGVDDIPVREFRRKVFEVNLGGKGIGCFNLKSIENVYDEKGNVYEDGPN